MNSSKSFKIKNPYRADQEIKQDVIIANDLTLDYANSPWVAIDTEYLSFNPLLDRLCVIQVASKENESSEYLRIEILYVYDNPQTLNLNAVLTNPAIEKIFHVFGSDLPRIEKFAGIKVEGSIYDTKVAAKIAWTNTTEHGMKSLIKMFIDPYFDQKANSGLNDWEIGPDNWTNEQVFYMMQDVVYLDALRQRINLMAQRRGRFELVQKAMTAIPTIGELYKAGYSESVYGY